LWVCDGPELCEEMEAYFRHKPRAEGCCIVDVVADGASTLLTTTVSYADGAERLVKVALRKCDPAWLVDWPATRALGECAGSPGGPSASPAVRGSLGLPSARRGGRRRARSGGAHTPPGRVV
jgi:hypothetical protein